MTVALCGLPGRRGPCTCPRWGSPRAGRATRAAGPSGLSPLLGLPLAPVLLAVTAPGVAAILAAFLAYGATIPLPAVRREA